MLDVYYNGYYTDRDVGNHVFLTYYSTEDNESKARNNGYIAATLSCCILSFLCSINIGMEMSEGVSIEDVTEVELNVTENPTRSLKKLIQFNNKLSALENEKKKQFIKCVEYYFRGLEFHYRMDLNEESLLSFFKIIEIVSTEYSKKKVSISFNNNIEKYFNLILQDTFGETYKNEYHSETLKNVKYSILKLLNTKRKIKYCIKDLGMEGFMTNEKIDEIIEIRHTELAHGNFNDETNFEPAVHIGDFAQLSREILSRYCFNEKFLKIAIKIDYDF